MNKNEVLEKSRKENRGKDLAEIEEINRASKFSFITLGILTIIFSIIISLRIKSFYPTNFMLSATWLSQSVFRLIKYFNNKKRSEILVSVILLFCGIGFFVIALKDFLD